MNILVTPASSSNIITYFSLTLIKWVKLYLYKKKKNDSIVILYYDTFIGTQ